MSILLQKIVSHKISIYCEMEEACMSYLRIIEAASFKMLNYAQMTAKQCYKSTDMYIGNHIYVYIRCWLQESRYGKSSEPF